MDDMLVIGLATALDVRALPAIELAAARLLAGHAPESVLSETTSHSDLHAARADGLLWVARLGRAPVGFAHVARREPGSVHLEELDVHPAHGRRGIGRALVREVCEWAARSGLGAVTLTTFRDVPFNMPFYASLGFVEAAGDTLTSTLLAMLDAEAARGLDRARRVAMRWVVPPRV